MIENFNIGILEFYHNLADVAGDLFTPLAKAMTFIGEGGVWLYILAGILFCFTKTRKMGVCLFGAVCCGALISNLILKDLVALPRPYESGIEELRAWWVAAGGIKEESFSFPSGHATAAAAGMTALALIWNKKILWFGVPYVTLMCAARNYLIAHYPTDVLAGACIGVVSAIIAYFITLGIYAFLEKFPDWFFSRWVLTDIDAGKLFKGKKDD